MKKRIDDVVDIEITFYNLYKGAAEQTVNPTEALAEKIAEELIKLIPNLYKIIKGIMSAPVGTALEARHQTGTLKEKAIQTVMRGVEELSQKGGGGAVGALKSTINMAKAVSPLTHLIPDIVAIYTDFENLKAEMKTDNLGAIKLIIKKLGNRLTKKDLTEVTNQLEEAVNSQSVSSEEKQKLKSFSGMVKLLASTKPEDPPENNQTRAS